MKREELYSAFSGIDDELLLEYERRAPKKRGTLLRFVGMAACFALLLTGLLWWHPWKGTESVPKSLKSPTSAPTSGTMTDAPISNNTLTPADELPTLVYGDTIQEALADICYPEGYFIRELTDAQLATIWGEDKLAWEGFSPSENGCAVSARAIYGGDGIPWIVSLTLTPTEGGRISVELSPEGLPPVCLVYDSGATCTVYGTEVTANAIDDHAVVSFLRGEGESAVGVRMELEGDLDTLRELTARIVSQSLREDGTLQLHQLDTADIPAWRSDALTEKEAYADEEFGTYLPENPAFSFRYAYREIGEGRNWLSAAYGSGKSELVLTLEHPQEVSTLVHANEPEKYACDYYGKEKPTVPDEYYQTWVDPVFCREELTMDLVESRLWQDDVGTSHANFGVLYSDGTVMRLNVSAGADELAAILDFLLS